MAGGLFPFMRRSSSGKGLLSAAAGTKSSLHTTREPLSLRTLLVRSFYAAAVAVLALYGSVSLEEAARRIAHSQTNNVPKRAQVLINLIGTGHLDSQLPMVQQQQLISSSVDGVREWRQEDVRETIPIVFVTSHVPKEPRHPALVVIEQARKLNNLVYVVGPNPNLKHLQALDVRIEGRNEYNGTTAWLARKMGITRIEIARPWILAAFMKRHNFSRVLSLSIDVMLYANVTEVVAWLYPDSKVVLPVRWPSMQPPPLPSQYTSTAVSNHAALWHIDALEEFLTLYKTIWQMALFGGRPGSSSLLRKKEYSEMTMLGWYAWSECWTNDKLDPPCMAEPITGVAAKLAYRLRRNSRFRPHHQVESLCQPRLCLNSSWSEEGLCVFDNNFSVASPSHFFRFAPARGDKCPSSKLYEHFHAWMGQVPRKNVQFLAVNFQGSRRDYLKLEDPDPFKTWGSAVF